VDALEHLDEGAAGLEALDQALGLDGGGPGLAVGDRVRVHRSRSAGWLFLRTPSDRKPEARAMTSSMMQTPATIGMGKAMVMPKERASRDTPQVSTPDARMPTTPTQKLSSMTIPRSEPMETPSARSEANSLMLAMIAPRKVCQVIDTPIRMPRNSEKPSMMTMKLSWSIAASPALASSGRVHALYWPRAPAFSWAATTSGVAPGRKPTMSGPTRSPFEASPSMRRVSRETTMPAFIMFG